MPSMIVRRFICDWCGAEALGEPVGRNPHQNVPPQRAAPAGWTASPRDGHHYLSVVLVCPAPACRGALACWLLDRRTYRQARAAWVAAHPPPWDRPGWRELSRDEARRLLDAWHDALNAAMAPVAHLLTEFGADR